MAMTQQAHPLRRLLSKFTSSDSELEANDLLLATERAGARRASDCACGEVVTLCGVVRTLTLHPSSKLPSLEVEMYDGSGLVRLVWLGRRRIVGVEPGCALSVTGRLNSDKEGPVMFNPRYDLLPTGRA